MICEWSQSTHISYAPESYSIVFVLSTFFVQLQIQKSVAWLSFAQCFMLSQLVQRVVEQVKHTFPVLLKEVTLLCLCCPYAVWYEFSDSQ